MTDPVRWPRNAKSSALAATTAVLVGGVLAGLLLARPVPYEVCLSLVAVLPLSGLVFAGMARFVLITGALVYAGALARVYTTEFVPLFSYQGMINAHPAGRSVLAVIVLAALPATWLPIAARRASTIVVWPLYLIGYVPAIVIPIFLTGELARVLPLALALLAAMAVLGLIVRCPALPMLHGYDLSVRGFTRLVATLSVLLSAYIVVSFGLNPPPSLGEVYSARSTFNAAEAAGHWAAGYLVPWAGNAINPLLMTLALWRRRADLFVVALAGQLIIYGDTGYKSILFSTALVPLVFLALSTAKRWYGLAVTAAVPVFFALGSVANAATSGWALGLLRRQFATPGQINYYYYDFFKDHNHFHLSASFLHSFFAMPYSSEPAELIGQVYLPAEQPHANAGVWADAFANFGFGGLLVFTVILGIVLWTLDGAAAGRDVRLIGPMLTVAGLTLAESPLFTTLLTLGLGLAGALVVLAPYARTASLVPPGDPPTPPRPDRRWIAEIRRRKSVDGMSRFYALARSDAGGATKLAESPYFAWPPRDAASSLKEMEDAARSMEDELTHAGWRAERSDDRWHAQRFIWQPHAARSP